jgi:hypothetical protein
MGEIAINPIHNVHKKYRTMNLVNSYIFTPPVTYNTYIGGISASVSSASLLATKLGISVGAISNFTIVGSDIKCKITGSYVMPNDSFVWNVLPSTYYTDSYYLVTAIGDRAFYNTSAFENTIADFRNATSIGDQAFASTKGNAYLLKNAVNILQKAFYNCFYSNIFYIPNCIDLGGSALYNEVFQSIKFGAKIYAHPSLATNNSGGVDGDLSYAVTQGAIVRYVTNYTVPSTVTDLSIGTVYSTAIQLNFTPPSSINAIDYYECCANGVLKNIISASGGFITGLTASTSYDITVISVDVFYNKSVVSNSVTQSTNATSAMPTTGLVSYYKLDETTAGVAVDFVNAKDLTNTGVVINEVGKIGRAYKSTAAGNLLTTNTAIPITGNFTINTWAFPTANATGVASLLAGYGRYADNAGFGLWVDTAGKMGWVVNQSYVFSATNQSIQLNSWTMITMIYNGSSLKIYFNSILAYTVARSINPNSSTTISMYTRTDYGGTFIGKLDEIGFYNLALTQNEIDLIYNNGNGITL